MNSIFNNNSIIINNIYNNIKSNINILDNLYKQLFSLSEIDEFTVNEPIMNIHDFINNLTNIKHINTLKFSNISEYQLKLLLQAFENINIDKLTFKNVNNLDIISLFLLKNKSIKMLDLSNNNIEDITSILLSLKNNISLEGLDLSNNKISNIDYIYEAFINNKTLITLNLSHNKISSIDSLCENIKNNTNNIENLDLSYNNIDEVSYLFYALKNNKTLINLNLSNNKISNIDYVYEAFKSNKTLTTLNLSYNKILSIDSLSKLIKNNNTIKELNLSKNILDDISILLDALINNSSIKILDLYYNNINNIDLIDIVLKNNNTIKDINLINNEIKHIDNFSNIIKIMKLKNIDIKYSEQYFNHSTKLIYDLYNNHQPNEKINISLDNEKEINIIVEYLLSYDFDNIELNINNDHISDNTKLKPLFNIIANNKKKVTKFKLSKIKDISEYNNIFKYNNTLTELYLNEPTIKELELILNFNHNLSKITIESNNDNIDLINNVFNIIYNYDNIIELNINNEYLKLNLDVPIRKIILDFTTSNKDYIYNILKIFDNININELVINNNKYKVSLTYPIFKNKYIQKLTINKCLINDDLINDLKQNTILNELHILNNFYEATITNWIDKTIFVSEITLSKILEILSVNVTLQILDLTDSYSRESKGLTDSYTRESEDLTNFIQKLLEVNKSIYSLNLSNNMNIKDYKWSSIESKIDIDVLCNIISNNNQISHLYIKSPITTYHMKNEKDKIDTKILKAMENNTTLIEFEY